MDVTLLHHTLPLGVTVALHQACLVAENDSISGGATSRPTDRPIGSRGFEKEGTKAWKGVFIHLCQMWRDKLFEHYLLWTFSQAEAGGRLTRAPFLMNGRMDSFISMDEWVCRRPISSPGASLSVPLGLQLL